jgi:hypothetical protein
MIRRYNDFVKGKVNEEFVMADPRRSTERTTPEVMPGITEKPGVMPSPPSPIKRERTSPVPAPAKAEVEMEMEEEGGDKYKKVITDLANELGTEVDEDGSINYEGKKINFYSETEMFHVDKKKFKTAEEVINYLEGSSSQTDLSLDGEIRSEKRNPSIESEMDEDDMSIWNKNNPHAPSKEDMDELMDAHDDDDFIEEEEEKFESKSYKSTRKFESFKNKKK